MRDVMPTNAGDSPVSRHLREVIHIEMGASRSHGHGLVAGRRLPVAVIGRRSAAELGMCVHIETDRLLHFEEDRLSTWQVLPDLVEERKQRLITECQLPFPCDLRAQGVVMAGEPIAGIEQLDGW